MSPRDPLGAWLIAMFALLLVVLLMLVANPGAHAAPSPLEHSTVAVSAVAVPGAQSQTPQCIELVPE